MADINNIIDPKLVQELEKMNQQLIEAGKNMDSLIPSMNKLAEVTTKISKSNEDNGNKRKKLTAAEKDAISIGKQLEKTEARINSIQQGQTKILTEQKVKLQQLTAEEKKAIKTREAAAGSLVKMREKLKQLTTQYDNAGKRTKAAASEINKLSKQIQKAEAATNRHGRSVGSYAKSIKSVGMQFLGALGLTNLVFMFVNVLKGSFNTIREFTKQNAVLAGVLGTTRKEIGELTEQAIRLGSIYPVTASEVNKLQVSFARLGFTQAEIINLTEATIQGSIALNSSLDETATLVGAVVKAFQDLGTEDASSIIDKLTLSTQKSSLSFESLETALPKVAGAANAMGISLDAVLSQLGIAQDATLDASISGTSLRNIYLELAKSGMTLDEALGQINSSQNKLSKAYQLFGKRSAIVGLALANNIEKTGEFESALNSAGGTAERVAEEQMATLDGSLKGLASSWEKLTLSARESEGVWSTIIDHIAKRLDTMSSEYTSFWQALFGLTGIGVGKATKQIQEYENVLNEISKAGHETELAELERHYSNMLGKNDAFDKNFKNAVKSRYESIAKEAEDSAKRALIAKQNADLEQLESEKNTRVARDPMMEIETKKIDFRIKNNEIEKAQLGDMSAFRIKTAEQTAEAELELERQLQEQKEAIRQREKEKAVELGNALFDFRINQLDRELIAAEGNEKRQLEIRRKLARAEKQKALFNIAINTASGVVEALPNLVLAAIVGGIGIAQAGIVLAQPIPQFAKGTDYAPGGLSLVGEAGREIIQNPRGELFMANNPALVNLERGSKVLTNKKTEAYLNDGNIVNSLNRVEKAIQRMPQPIFKNGSKIAERRGNYWKNYKLRSRLN